MAKEFQEPEEKEMDEMMDDFSPLDEAIAEKAYTKPNVKFNANDMNNDIPEPSFIPPPIGGDTMTEEDKIKKPREPFNQEMKDMPKKDKHDAASKVAQMIMTGYKWANSYADSTLLFDPKKIQKMEINGEINLSVQVPISANDTISAGEFIQEYNDQSKDTITVSSEFEEEFVPALTKVLEKRGVGMTEEQYVIYLLGKDLLVKGFLVAQSISVKKEMLNMLKEINSSLQQQAPQPQPQPTQPSQPTQSIFREQAPPEYNEAPNVNDIVNQMTGAYQKPIMSEPIESEPTYQEPKSEVTILVDAPKSNLGKRGRPKKNK
jgi:hypothetical protein